MSRAASKVFDAVATKARTVDAYVERMERLHHRGAMSQSDLLRVYGGAFLTFHSFTENAIEDLFIGIVNDRILHSDGSVKSLVKIASPVVARRVVYGGRSYVDWLPFNKHTMPRADAFLSRGKPFDDLAKQSRNHLDGMTVIRNAVAHESGHALKMFRRHYTDGKALPPDHQKPPGYLRGRHAAGQTRLNYLFSETLLAFRTLCGC